MHEPEPSCHNCPGDYDTEKSQFDNIVYMPCNPSNDFFPDLANTPRADIVYFCSPNNPTGAAATRAQCKQLIDWANEKGSIVVYDAAYAPFVRNEDVPKSIFEIEVSQKWRMTSGPKSSVEASRPAPQLIR